MQENNRYSVSLAWQVILGILFAFLNFAVNCLNKYNPFPLYMDTLFTVSASFFGMTSGLICAILYHFICTFINHYEISTLVWAVCSLTVVLIIRIYLLKRNKIGAIDILLLVFLVALSVSLEGAIIFTIMHALTNYAEDSHVKFMYTLLSSNNIPVFISALLPRVPVNILDKGICVSLGYLCYLGLIKFFKR
ncbi:hypothetical protein [uncultured Treponema sp.]|uniref:hypothetical protein n=1 Tax=uncultured Treponema sp. TaxID=162155 RepID=UPI0025FB3F14|nr:hypothetical protein [uncultured Treponema sp.]